jgi:hypothetical protein
MVLGDWGKDRRRRFKKVVFAKRLAKGTPEIGIVVVIHYLISINIS